MLFSVRICYCKSGKTKVIFFDKENFNFQLKVLEYKISLNGRNKNLWSLESSCCTNKSSKLVFYNSRDQLDSAESGLSHMFLICLSSLGVFMGWAEACPGPARHF